MDNRAGVGTACVPVVFGNPQLAVEEMGFSVIHHDWRGGFDAFVQRVVILKPQDIDVLRVKAVDQARER